MRLTRWPDPLPAGIEVYRIDFDFDADAAMFAARQLLTSSERARADRFTRTADRVRFTQARAALRRLLAARVGCEPAEVPLATGPHGKPHLAWAGGSGPPFNLSHSGSHALIALGDERTVSEVGIDIEACGSDVDIEGIATLAFTACERDEVRTAPDPLQAFYSRWTGKEAVLKAIGLGVAEQLQSIGLHPGAHGRFTLASSVPGWTHFQAVALDAPTGYAAALAWHAKEST